MWFPVVAWIVLVCASAFFAGTALNLHPAEISVQFSVLPAPQRFALGAIIFTTLALIGSSVWQAYSLARQNKLLRERLMGLRQGVLDAQGTQTESEAVVQHLANNDPQEAIATIEKATTETEARAALQESKSASVDMQDRLNEIRRRQQVLRQMVGAVADKRRVIEPVFGELVDRQRQLERWLTDLETDDNKRNLADRLKELDQNVSVIHERQGALQASLVTLNRFKEELDKSQAELVPLGAPEIGIEALIAEVATRRDRLTATLDGLETSGDDKVSSRVEALSRAKVDIVQRVARLDDCSSILDTIRLDFEEIMQRQAHLERSLAEVEKDPSGTSLVDRQNAIGEFVVQSRLRLEKVQASAAMLSQFKEGLAKSQADLAPLQAPVFGVEALIGEVNANRAVLIKTLDEIESNGVEELGSRVEAISRAKLEIDGRLAQIFENFQKLDSMRKDIGEKFTSIRSTLNRIG